MTTEVLQSLIAVGGVIYAATVTLLIAIYRRNNTQKEAEVTAAESAASTATHEARIEKLKYKFINEVNHPLVSLVHWQPVADSIERLTKETSIDRVLLLTAVNGITKPTHTSAVWQFRPNFRDFVPYSDEKLDDDYIDRMLLMKRSRYIKFKTSDVPAGTKIHGFYQYEKVIECVWVLLGIRVNPDTGQIAYKYVSFATHSECGISDEDLHRILIVASDLKSTIYASGFTSMVA